MAVFASILLSSAFLAMFTLSMAWIFASEPVLLGTVLAVFELTTNLAGIALSRFWSPLSSARQLQIAWLLRCIGSLLLLTVHILPLQIVGVMLVAATLIHTSSLEKASLIATEASSER